MPRHQTNINQIIGLTKDGEWVCIDYAFEHDGDFRGVTGSSMRVVTKGEYDERMDPENAAEHLEDVWRMMVTDSEETRSLDEYVEAVLDADGADAIFDMSYSRFHDEIIAYHDAAVKAKAEAEGVEVDPNDLGEICEALGGGRMFCKDGIHFTPWADFEFLTPDASKYTAIIAEYEKYTMAEEQAMQEANRSKYAD
jgi:hypothetical protein